MAQIINNRLLGDELIKRGLVPEGCRLLEMVITPTGGTIVRYEVFVSPDRLALFAEAFQAVASRKADQRADETAD